MQKPFIIISLFLSVRLLVPLAVFADQADLKSKVQDLTNAQNEYYKALKNLKNPTPAQIEDLQNQILKPAQDNLYRSQSAYTKEEEDKQMTDVRKDLEKKIEKMKDQIDGMKDEKTHNKAQSVLNDALNGNPFKFRRINPITKKETIVVIKAPSPSTKSKVSAGGPSPSASPQPSVTPTPEALDGSKLPREIEFPGAHRRR